MALKFSSCRSLVNIVVTVVQEFRQHHRTFISWREEVHLPRCVPDGLPGAVVMRERDGFVLKIGFWCSICEKILCITAFGSIFAGRMTGGD